MTARDAPGPSRMGRPRQGAPSRRGAILDAALALFIERGLGATTMGEIAAKAGASKATLYRLFPDTEALFTAVLTREVEMRRGAIADALEGPDVAVALAQTAQAMLDALDDRAVELFRLAIAEAGRHPDLGRSFYGELVQTAAAPIAKRLDAHFGCGASQARVLALQFIGSIKEALFYPRLLGVPVDHDQGPIIEWAVRATLDAER